MDNEDVKIAEEICYLDEKGRLLTEPFRQDPVFHELTGDSMNFYVCGVFLRSPGIKVPCPMLKWKCFS